MPPRASGTVSRIDLAYSTTTQPSTKKQVQMTGHTSFSSFELKGNQSFSSIRHTGDKSRRRPRATNITVNFDFQTIKTIEVEHLEDLPGEDIWYSRDEYDAIKARNTQIVRLIKAGEFEENDEYSCRGLEHKLKEIFRQRRANKFNALNAVLEEQDRQINRGINDAVLISAAYQTVSVKCQESANTIAFRDYRYSHNYDPNTPATGFDQPIPPPLGDSQSHSTPANESKSKKKKKKEKKDKYKEKDKYKGEDPNAEDEDPMMSPKGEKKKGKYRKMARGARKMMRRMSM